MIGLDGQTINNFKSTLKRILELNPSTVSIYPLKPRNEYLTKHFNSSSEKFYKHLHDLILPAENYIQGLVRIKKYKWPNPLKADRQATPSILLLHPYKYSSRYQFESNIKKSVFGLGPGANSYIFSKLEYRCISSNNRFHFKGFQKNTRLSMIQFILRSLSIYRSVKSELFVSSFQKELLNEFKEAITKLKETNLMEYENNELKFTTDDPKKQFYACLFFFEDKDVINSINREMVDNLIRFYINSNEYTFRIEIVNPKVSYYAKEGLFSLIHLEKNKLINQEDELVKNEIGKMFTEICQNHINYSPSIILKNLSKEIIKKHPRLKSKFPQLSLKISVKG